MSASVDLESKSPVMTMAVGRQAVGSAPSEVPCSARFNAGLTGFTQSRQHSQHRNVRTQMSRRSLSRQGFGHEDLDDCKAHFNSEV